MLVEYLGHACYFIRTPDVSVLVDPLVEERFQDDTAEVFPRRAIDLDAMPAPDIIVITHCHPGHLEVASLARFDRRTQVLHPKDATIELALTELGFRHRDVVEHGSFIAAGETSILITGTVSDITEVGVAVRHAGQVAWHLADTEVNEAIVADVRRRLGAIDFLVSGYAAYNNQFFTHLRLDFPADDVAFFVEQVCAIAPRLACANFIGFAYVGAGEWLNHYMFPTSRQRFLSDVRRASNARIDTVDLAPGDCVELANGAVTVNHGGVACVRLLKPEGVAPQFDASAGIPALCDPSPVSESAALRASVRAFVCDEFYPWLREAVAGGHAVLARYAALGANFRLHVVMPDTNDLVWDLSLGDLPERPSEGRSVNAPQMALRIAASALIAWARGDIPYYRAYLHARAWSNLYSLYASADGAVQAVYLNGAQPGHALTRITGLNPVSVYLGGDVERCFHPWLRRRIARLLKAPG